jgi:hypothetical protein
LNTGVTSAGLTNGGTGVCKIVVINIPRMLLHIIK